MKLGMMTGWAAVCLLGMGTLLTPSKVSAGFVTIDEFEETPLPSDTRLGPDAERWFVDATSGGSLSLEFEKPLGSEDWVAYFGYDNIALDEFTALQLSSFVNNSGGVVTATAFVLDAPLGATLDTAVGILSNGELNFDVAGGPDAKALEFEFVWQASGAGESVSEPTGPLTSSSLQANFVNSSAPQATPEPTSLVLFGLASAGGGLAAWRNRRKQNATAVPS